VEGPALLLPGGGRGTLTGNFAGGAGGYGGGEGKDGEDDDGTDGYFT